MSIDTRDKRASVAAAGLTWLVVGPTPDASLATSADRLHVAGLYRGPFATLAAASPPRAGARGGLRVGDRGGVCAGARGGIRSRRLA